VQAKSEAEKREGIMSVPDLRNETLNLIDDFILDHIDDFSQNEMIWIINELEEMSTRFYEKFKAWIDDDIEDLLDELDEE
jgi:hypothetical protein